MIPIKIYKVPKKFQIKHLPYSEIVKSSKVTLYISSAINELLTHWKYVHFVLDLRLLAFGISK